jgi:hypothetical protein
MRHFLPSPSAITALALSMGKAAPAAFLKAPTGGLDGLTAGGL